VRPRLEVGFIANKNLALRMVWKLINSYVVKKPPMRLSLRAVLHQSYPNQSPAASVGLFFGGLVGCVIFLYDLVPAFFFPTLDFFVEGLFVYSAQNKLIGGILYNFLQS
jgi:hypothetical protein